MKPRFEYDFLHHHYVVLQKSINQIAEETGAQPEVVRRNLHRLNIETRRAGGKKQFRFKKADLIELYVNQKKSMKEIADIYGCGETCVFNKMDELGIERRSKSEALSGVVFSKEHREKLSKAKLGKRKGDKNPNWRGGVSVDNTIIRKRAKYTAFRSRVLRHKGDFCNECGKDLHARCPTCGHKEDRHVHHLSDFANNKDLQHDFDNAVVLCEECHRKLHFNRD